MARKEIRPMIRCDENSNLSINGVNYGPDEVPPLEDFGLYPDYKTIRIGELEEELEKLRYENARLKERLQNG